MVFRETIAQELEGIFRAVDDFELLEVFRGNRTGIDEGLEVEDAMPVLTAVDNDENFLSQLVGLRQREDFKEFIHGAEAAWEDDEGFSEIGEPEFAHEEEVKLEVKRWSVVLVGTLFEGQLDIQSTLLPSRFVGAEVGGFHDAGTAAGGHHETAAAGGNLDRPCGQHMSETAGAPVVGGPFAPAPGEFTTLF